MRLHPGNYGNDPSLQFKLTSCSDWKPFNSPNLLSVPQMIWTIKWRYSKIAVSFNGAVLDLAPSDATCTSNYYNNNKWKPFWRRNKRIISFSDTASLSYRREPYPGRTLTVTVIRKLTVIVIPL